MLGCVSRQGGGAGGGGGTEWVGGAGMRAGDVVRVCGGYCGERGVK